MDLHLSCIATALITVSSRLQERLAGYNLQADFLRTVMFIYLLSILSIFIYLFIYLQEQLNSVSINISFQDNHAPFSTINYLKASIKTIPAYTLREPGLSSSQMRMEFLFSHM